jgi:hypothetical protein
MTKPPVIPVLVKTKIAQALTTSSGLERWPRASVQAMV